MEGSALKFIGQNHKKQTKFTLIYMQMYKLMLRSSQKLTKTTKFCDTKRLLWVFL